ncbi:MAG: SUMF1/EgtB/PvdO family nonheme iron enzyme [Bacteroidota bacterium]|nr:SUMF1/EgtB/PvdO family nonheme iron enzyme [Bacteroidota bacterium]
MPQTRQLAAIMFTDIVGYTALMEADEVLAMQFRERMKQKLEAEIRIHGGRIIKLSGDGALCCFDSAIESVRVAIALQIAMQQEPRVPVRIGIHQADVIFEESDVFGDGVNIASRLESLAIPGSIFISAKVFDDIKNQKDIQTVLLGKYSLKNVKEPVEIFAVCNPGLHVPLNKKLEGKGIKYVSQKLSIGKKTLLIRLVSILLLVAVGGYLLIPPILKKQHARNKLLPAIQKLANENYLPGTEAFEIALKAEKYIANDSALIRLWPLVSVPVSFETEPEGAEVFWKDYDKPNLAWRSAGSTPLDSVRFPRTFIRGEIRKEGYQTIEFAGTGFPKLTFDKVGSLPENMVRIPTRVAPMTIVGLERHVGKTVGEFLIDRYEVTNKQFKAFIEAGGYTNKKFWNYPISPGKDNSVVVAGFTDRTGRQGPANWEAGTYPDGMENHPVTGISWYEASAYAAYANKQLPTVFHWSAVALTGNTAFLVPLSNFNGKTTVPVGSLAGHSYLGVYDIAGNAREWCLNESSVQGQRFILGGGWNDPTYAFNDSYTQNALDRSQSNGFRCIKELPGDSTMGLLTGPVTMAFRDYWKEKPVDDKIFAIYLQHFSYDKTPLNAKIEKNIDGESWKAEKITFDAGYNNERMEAYLYLPKKFQPPFQTIVFFPGSGVIYLKKYDPETAIKRIDFILKSGRAVIVPIYKGTYERYDSLKTSTPDETVFHKDHVIMWRKDIGRTIDYLETRKEIQPDKIGYLGISWGGRLGGTFAAIEKRLKVVVLAVGGLKMEKTLPEIDQINFLPRVVQPVLMLNGKHDMYFPVETSQKPMFELLGTPKKDKNLIIYDAGHQVPLIEFVKESLHWYDKYLGPVK